MSEILTQLDGVLQLSSDTLAKYGYSPLENCGNENEVFYSGEHGIIKFTYENEKVFAFEGKDAEDPESATKRIFLCLLSSSPSQRDLTYVSNEFNSILDDKYGVKEIAPKSKKAGSNKPAQTVSKAAVKNGSFYDPTTLASKLCLVFPELREQYKEAASGKEFLYEEYFKTYATPKIISAIKQNNPATMKKLFQVLNEIYEDGSNDTQTLIAVSILGTLDNDQILLARCIDYMSPTLTPTVIEVNKYLATSSGKKAKKKLENPPVYKPKKNKQKKGLMDKLMGGGGTLQNQ